MSAESGKSLRRQQSAGVAKGMAESEREVKGESRSKEMLTSSGA